MAAPASGAARTPACGGRDRLEPGERRQRERLSAKKGGLPPARTRRIGARRAPSATSSPTPVARRRLVLTGANCHDSPLMAPTLVEAIPPLRSGRRGRPRQRPDKLHADKAYDAPVRRGRSAGRGGSRRGLPDAASREVTGSGGTAGWSSAAMPGSTAPAACPSLRTARRHLRGLQFLQASLITLNQIKRFC